MQNKPHHFLRWLYWGDEATKSRALSRLNLGGNQEPFTYTPVELIEGYREEGFLDAPLRSYTLTPSIEAPALGVLLVIERDLLSSLAGSDTIRDYLWLAKRAGLKGPIVYFCYTGAKQEAEAEETV